jgi:hypothetical protein
MHWIRRHGGAGWTVFIPLAGWALSSLFGPLLLMPQAALLLPAFVCWAERRAGLLAAVLLLLGLSAGLSSLFGPMAGALALAILLPTCVLGFILYRKDAPFWQSALACVGLLALTGTGLLLAFQLFLGESPVAAAVSSLEAWLESSEQKSDLLAMAWRYGLARTSEASALQDSASLVMTPEVEKELAQSLLTTLDLLLRNALPGQIITGSILGGLLCVALPRWEAARDMEALHPPVAPPVHLWYLPNPLLGKAGLLLVGLFLVSGLGLPAMSLAVHLAWTALQCVLALQGVAVADDYLRKRNVRRAMRTVGSVAIFTLLNGACVVLGLIDAIANFRHIPPTGRGPLLPWTFPKDEEED